LDYSDPDYTIPDDLRQEASMEKSIFTREYAVLLQTLRQLRRGERVTQVELARRLGQSQSFVSKCERGETRLDLVQLRRICLELDSDLVTFVRRFEKNLKRKR
jgi:transcriptional regulator with XRE-family HTH domain